MDSTEVVLRSRSSRALGVAMVVVGLAGAGSTVADGSASVLRYAAPMLLFALAGWAAFWRPEVVVSPAGVRVVNTLRTVEVPWPAVREVQGRYGLRLVTAYGTVNAWGAPAPGGRDRARDADSEAAAEVRRRLAELRAAGHLADPRLERTALPTTWHRGVIAAAGALVVAGVLLPLAA